MKVIQCDKCKKILMETEERFNCVNLELNSLVDLCKECRPKYEEMEKEYSVFEKEAKEMFSLALKKKIEELEKKYFGKEKENEESNAA